MASVLRQYRDRVEAGLLSDDPVQAEAAARLDDLALRLANPPKSRWLSKPEPVTGLYLWGGVGRGKSMLMDLFFERTSPPRTCGSRSSMRSPTLSRPSSATVWSPKSCFKRSRVRARSTRR
ncbi:MAG: hypothetical protein B7Z08_09870 [Sphingomonadales bacterium 32-68-7]|nr:MAG: hypothetical protein B7Z08_09870 [Sphingomonadales bacterium 32-68-7]